MMSWWVSVRSDHLFHLTCPPSELNSTWVLVNWSSRKTWPCMGSSAVISDWQTSKYLLSVPFWRQHSAQTKVSLTYVCSPWLFLEPPGATPAWRDTGTGTQTRRLHSSVYMRWMSVWGRLCSLQQARETEWDLSCRENAGWRGRGKSMKLWEGTKTQRGVGANHRSYCCEIRKEEGLLCDVFK